MGFSVCLPEDATRDATEGPAPGAWIVHKHIPPSERGCRPSKGMIMGCVFGGNAKDGGGVVLRLAVAAPPVCLGLSMGIPTMALLFSNPL